MSIQEAPFSSPTAIIGCRADCQIVHNTVHDPDNRLQRLIRLAHDNDGLLVANNLLSGPPMRIETSSRVRLLGNVTRDLTGDFVNSHERNLHLRGPVAGVLDAAGNVPGIPHDIDSERRSEPADVGADEFVPLSRRGDKEKTSASAPLQEPSATPPGFGLRRRSEAHSPLWIGPRLWPPGVQP